VLDCITEDNERSVRTLVSVDERMGAQMKAFLLRCLDKSPNSRPAAIDLMSDPWLAAVNQNVSAPHPFHPSCRTPRARSSITPATRVCEIFYNHLAYAAMCRGW
jgi:serine/threonine protein kinase